MAMDEQATCLRRVAAESQNSLDVPSLWQQDVWTWLDRIVKAERGAKVRIERPERRWIWPVRVKDRKNMGDAAALVADEFVKPANGEGWEGWRLHGRAP